MVSVKLTKMCVILSYVLLNLHKEVKIAYK